MAILPTLPKRSWSSESFYFNCAATFVYGSIDKIPRVEELEEEASGANIDLELPTLILAIEEPELYQHPARQRHFANVLLKLAGDKIVGVARRTQVLYCTHSPLFVGLDRFDEIRLLRKISSEEINRPKMTKVSSATLTQVAEKIWEAWGRPSSRFTADTLRPRLHSILTPWMNEGFFADVVVLVEGEDDRVAIAAVAGPWTMNWKAME